jgi:pilus assembly protein CpaB
MNVTRIVVLVVALGAGGGAAYLALNMINQEPGAVVATTAPAPAIQTEEVLVATLDIPLGATLEANQLTWRAWPLSAINAAYIRRSQSPDGLTDLLGAVARSAFYAGEPITAAKLARTEGGLLAALLPAGMRAVAITISTDTGAGGFILPNDHVDVIMTRHATDNTDRFITETILQNIRILAIDQTIAEQNGTAVVVGRTATLELTPLQAEIITVAQQMGDRLALSLRSIADAEQVLAPDADAVHLITGDARTEGVTVVRNGVAQQVGP